MLENSRHITVGIMAEIPLEQQLLIWSILDAFLEKGISVDYLQIIELSIRVDERGKKQQLIKHRQEIPAYEEEYLFSVMKPIRSEIFVIDDGNVTMLLAAEY